MSSPAAFWDAVAERYAARPVSDPGAYAATLDRVRAHLRPDAHVLEVGCGTGLTALRLADAVASYTATDFSPRMIAIARARPVAPGAPAPTFRCAPLDAPDGTAYDAVLAFSVLHLQDDPGQALAALRARLAPGGLLISKTPCLAEINPLLRWGVLPLLRLTGKLPRMHLLRAAALEEAIRAAGFEILETGDYPRRIGARLVVARRTDPPAAG